MKEQVLEVCQGVFPQWRGLPIDDFEFQDPKGFSSFTMTVTCKRDVEPGAVLYRHLGDKENAILDFEGERRVFLQLGAHKIAAHCYHYDRQCRIEEFYSGRTLKPTDLQSDAVLAGIAGELHRFHQLDTTGLPSEPFFTLMHRQWGQLAKRVLEAPALPFPDNEKAMCEELRVIYDDSTLAKVQRFMPDEAPCFCHNDTYHGNAMLLDSGAVKLLDFEFSCLNHRAFDFSNLFAETCMRHGLTEYPHFRIAEPTFRDADIACLVEHYLRHQHFDSAEERRARTETLCRQTRDLIPVSHFFYAMAAIPLALEPIQKIRFIPYAHARFKKFEQAYDARFGA